MTGRLSTGFFAVALACSVIAASFDTTESMGGPRAGPSQTQELYDEIAAMDARLFAAVFDTCDTATLATLVTDDFEFFHEQAFAAEFGQWRI